MACKTEISTLSVLINCPADTEQLLFFNVAGQSTGMALRTWATIKACLLSGIAWDRIQFQIGTLGSLMVVGDTVLVIDVPRIFENSAFVFLDSNTLYEDDSTQISYDIVYTDTEITITFNQAVRNGQKYRIVYARIL